MDLHRYAGARVCVGVLRCARMFIEMCGCAQVCIGVHFNMYPIQIFSGTFYAHCAFHFELVGFLTLGGFVESLTSVMNSGTAVLALLLAFCGKSV